MPTPLINGRAYDFTQIIVTILGVPVVSVSKISYNQKQEKKNNYGQGSFAVSRGQGVIEADASIEMSMNDIEAIRDVALNGSLLNVPSFDITIFFGNAQKPITHVLKNCEFISDGLEASQGDTDIKQSFDLVVSHVKFR
jgi:hypothetical protein